MTLDDMKAATPYTKKEQDLVDQALARHEEYPPPSAHQVKVIGRTFGLAMTRASGATLDPQIAASTSP